MIYECESQYRSFESIKIDVTLIIAYTGNTPWWERATVAQSLQQKFKQT